MRFIEKGRVVLRVELLEHRAMPSNLFSELHLTESLDWSEDPFSNYWLWSDEDSASRIARIAAKRWQPLDNEEHSAKTIADAISALMPTGTVDHSTSTTAATVGAPRMLEFDGRWNSRLGQGSPASPMSGLSVTAHIYGDGPAEDCIPVNANNDNGSGWVPNTNETIPVRRDFAFDGPMNAADPQLRRINVGISKDDGNGNITGVLGTLNMSVTANGVGRARLWKDNLKTASFQPLHVKFGGTAWIEGTHESRPDHDVVINVDFTPDNAGDGGPVHLTFGVSITPVIQQFSVLPALLPNVAFLNGIDATQGLKGFKPASGGTPAIPGATFWAETIDFGIYDGALGTGMSFVQNITHIENGLSKGGKGWYFTDGSAGQNLVLTDGELPILDAFPWAAWPIYGSPQRITYGDVAIWTDSDSPSSGWPTNSANTLVVNLTYRFALFLVCEYTDGSLWPVANTTWSIKFHSTMNIVFEDSRVIWPGVTIYDNTIPQKLVSPIFNLSNEWSI